MPLVIESAAFYGDGNLFEFIFNLLNRIFATNEPDEEHDYRNDQKQVNEPSQGIRGDKSKEPQYQQNYSYGY